MRGSTVGEITLFLIKNISLVVLEKEKCGQCLMNVNSDKKVLKILKCTFLVNPLKILQEVGQDKTKETLY